MESCDDERLNNCFICQSFYKKKCMWIDNKCQVGTSRTISNWWNTFDGCTDYLDLCRTEKYNETFYQMSIKFNQSRQIDPDEDIIPQNYYCKFEIDIPRQGEAVEDVQWEVVFQRYIPILFSEQIDLEVTDKDSK